MFPRVKEVVIAWDKAGIDGVKAYYEQEGMEVVPNTWCETIKTHIDEGHTISVDMEINLIREKLNFYKDVSEEKSRASSGTVDGQGNKENKR